MPATPERMILGQGDRDSACFLYSLANAAQVLTGDRITAAQWSSAVANLPRPTDYLRADTGTSSIDRSALKLKDEAKQILSSLCPENPLTVDVIKPISRNYDFTSILSEGSVLVMANNEHWFCLLEVYKRRAYVACSAAWQDHSAKYMEQRHGRLRRLSNDSFPLEKLEFYRPWALMVSHES